MRCLCNIAGVNLQNTSAIWHADRNIFLSLINLSYRKNGNKQKFLRHYGMDYYDGCSLNDDTNE